MALEDNLLQEIQDFRDESEETWQPIFDECKIDMRFVVADHWDPTDKKKREDAFRPCLSLDEIGQYFNQGINNLRANPIGMKFAPRGSGATAKGADFYQDKAREIEYRSKAEIAYITAAENMFHQGIGWVRVTTKFKEKSFNKEIWIEPVMNPLQVLPDPQSVWPDSRDMKRLAYIETRALSEFKREFPKAKPVNFDTVRSASASKWAREGKIDVGEYWVTVPTTRRLLMVTPRRQPNGPVQHIWRDELRGGKVPDGWMVRREEDREDTTVCSYLTNGLEILKKNEWAGKWIPFVSWFGKVLFVDGQRVIQSMTRPMRAPQLAYSIARTAEIEIIGLTTKNPYWAYAGQLTPKMLNEVAKSLHEPVAVLEAAHTVEGLAPDAVLPLPQRNQFNAELAGQAQFAEEMRRGVQAAAGVSPMPTAMQRDNQKSGKFIEEFNASMQKGNFHFADHHKDGVTRIAEIVGDLIAKIHDTAGDEWVRAEDGQTRQVRINDPAHAENYDLRGEYVPEALVGPNDEKAHEEADDFFESHMEVLAQLVGPQVAAKVMSLLVKRKEFGAIGEQIADLIEPPSFKAQDGKPPDPNLAKAQAIIQQLQQHLQQATQELQTKQAEIAAKLAADKESINAKLQADLQKIEAQRQADLQTAAMDRETRLAVAEETAKAKDYQFFLEERNRVGLQEKQLAHEARLADQKMAHEKELHATKQMDDKEQRALDRTHALAAKKTKTVTTTRDPKTGALSANVVVQSAGGE